MEVLTDFKSFKRSLAQGDTYTVEGRPPTKAVGSVSGETIRFADGHEFVPGEWDRHEVEGEAISFHGFNGSLTYQRDKVAFPPITLKEEAARRPRAPRKPRKTKRGKK